MSTPSDESYLFALFETIYERYNEVGFEPLEPEEKVFVSVWSLEAEVNNGGFRLFFENCGHLGPSATVALQDIGAQQVAEIVGKALDAVGDDATLQYDERRWAHLDTLDDAALGALDKLDAAFYEYPDDLAEKLAAYMRECGAIPDPETD